MMLNYLCVYSCSLLSFLETVILNSLSGTLQVSILRGQFLENYCTPLVVSYFLDFSCFLKSCVGFAFEGGIIWGSPCWLASSVHPILDYSVPAVFWNISAWFLDFHKGSLTCGWWSKLVFIVGEDSRKLLFVPFWWCPSLTLWIDTTNLGNERILQLWILVILLGCCSILEMSDRSRFKAVNYRILQAGKTTSSLKNGTWMLFWHGFKTLERIVPSEGSQPSVSNEWHNCGITRIGSSTSHLAQQLRDSHQVLFV